jgi:hypothetical protein
MNLQSLMANTSPSIAFQHRHAAKFALAGKPCSGDGVMDFVKNRHVMRLFIKAVYLQ